MTKNVETPVFYWRSCSHREWGEQMTCKKCSRRTKYFEHSKRPEKSDFADSYPRRDIFFVSTVSSRWH